MVDCRLVFREGGEYLEGPGLKTKSSQESQGRGLDIPRGEGPDMVPWQGHSRKAPVSAQRYASQCVKFGLPVPHDGIVQGGWGSVNWRENAFLGFSMFFLPKTPLVDKKLHRFYHRFSSEDVFGLILLCARIST